MVGNSFKHKIASIYAYGGGEYTCLITLATMQWNWTFNFWPYTPQRVTINERRHPNIVEITWTLLNEDSLHQSFVFHHTVYLLNILTTPGLNNDSPYRKLFGEKYSTLKFLILCYPMLKPYTHNKV